MQWIVHSEGLLRAEFLSIGVDPAVQIIHVAEASEFSKYPSADAFFDLISINAKENVLIWSALLPKPVFVNSVSLTTRELLPGIIRINAWPGFLGKIIIEASAGEEQRSMAEKIFSLANRRIDWLSDEPGFIAPRILSMIINEAYFALGEKLSTRDEIDLAMKLGTNYPYGPFEWAKKIGLANIHELLSRLAKTNGLYKPAPLLTEELNY